MRKKKKIIPNIKTCLVCEQDFDLKNLCTCMLDYFNVEGDK